MIGLTFDIGDRIYHRKYPFLKGIVLSTWLDAFEGVELVKVRWNKENTELGLNIPEIVLASEIVKEAEFLSVPREWSSQILFEEEEGEEETFKVIESKKYPKGYIFPPGSTVEATQLVSLLPYRKKIREKGVYSVALPGSKFLMLDELSEDGQLALSLDYNHRVWIHPARKEYFKVIKGPEKKTEVVKELF